VVRDARIVGEVLPRIGRTEIRAPDSARYAGEQSIQIKATVPSELNVSLNNSSLLFHAERQQASLLFNQLEEDNMSVEQDNKAIVGRWFTNFWGKTCDLTVVDEIAAPEMLLHYSLHEPRRALPGAPRSLSNVRLHAACISAWVESSRCGCSRLFSGAPRIGRAAYIRHISRKIDRATFS